MNRHWANETMIKVNLCTRALIHVRIAFSQLIPALEVTQSSIFLSFYFTSHLNNCRCLLLINPNKTKVGSLRANEAPKVEY